MGRGYTRNLGVRLCKGNFILMVDATNIIEKDFVWKALKYFKDNSIAAVSGTLRTFDSSTFIDRWRTRHLFKENKIGSSMEKSSMLITYGTLFSKKHINCAGGFNHKLRYKEDEDLGKRFRDHNIFVIGDPNISVFCVKKNSILEVLERYCRWYMDIDEKISFRGYFHNIKASIKPMMEKDLKDKDYLSALISLLVPHFQLIYSIRQHFKNL